MTDFIGSARRTLAIERQALADLEGRLDHRFEQAIVLLAECRGKVIISGMGKSGLIGQKIAATLASTGTASFFLHPAEGSHGDLGVVGPDDVLVLLSNSGESEEIVRLLPALKRLRVPVIAMTGKIESTLGAHADVTLDVSVREEACPLGLAPTASTTALLAFGDALAVALLEYRGFTSDDFAAVHPGGALGKRLLTRVRDVMHTGDELPLIGEGAPLKDALWVITSKRFGACGIIDAEGHLTGVITDGDVRRGLDIGPDFFSMTVSELMTKHPKTISPDALAVEALNIMEQHTITSLFVLNAAGQASGMIHMHDLLRAGVV